MQEGLNGGFGSALILGLVEGATEFLPISSTGHLIVVGEQLLGENSDAAKFFEIFIQLGAICAIVWHYRQRLRQMLQSITDWRSPGARLAVNLFIAFLPAAFFGLLLHDLIKQHLFSSQTVAVALIVGGIIIIVVERRPRAARVSDLSELSRRDAVIIGLAQSLALFPGVSRAGATIIGGLLNGLDRKSATEFSFLLALPTMFAAALFDLWNNRDLLNPDLAGQLAFGFVVAFITALIVIRVLLHYITRRTFTVFGWYRIVFGVIILFILI